jgi:hypothetical protein
MRGQQQTYGCGANVLGRVYQTWLTKISSDRRQASIWRQTQRLSAGMPEKFLPRWENLKT